MEPGAGETVSRPDNKRTDPRRLGPPVCQHVHVLFLRVRSGDFCGTLAVLVVLFTGPGLERCLDGNEESRQPRLLLFRRIRGCQRGSLQLHRVQSVEQDISDVHSHWHSSTDIRRRIHRFQLLRRKETRESQNVTDTFEGTDSKEIVTINSRMGKQNSNRPRVSENL